MPPKAKFTKEEIIKAALEIVREDGFDALTARTLAAKLGSSARPIFTVFPSMEEVCREVVKAARALYAEYVERGLGQTKIPAFKGVGVEYIKFALAEPKLFQVLFMSQQPQKPAVGDILQVIEEHYQQIVASIQDEYGLNREEAVWMYRHLWIYTHGIAVLCVTNMCTFTREDMSKMMSEIFDAVLKKRKEGEKND
ncbi:MAG: TetR/AcrR family transcriptional regulator [Lachnospiraceae bacterium]|jgi:AcrR family transcriptional regulator|nr:TetR/AcrR family transcriptional regulator [Lachnospiraceae bacterium]